MLKTAVLIAGLAIAQLTAEKPPQAQPPAPKPAPATPAAPAAKPPAPAPTAPRQSAARPTITVTVSDRQGSPLSNVTVRATGPAERDGSTDTEGTVTFRNVANGTYRLRFDHDSHVPFEKEVTVAGGRPVRTTAELTAAPPPPPPPPPPPKPDPEPPPPSSSSSPGAPSGPPSSLDLINFWEKNSLQRGTPFKSSQIGCSGTATSSLLQFRGVVAEHTHTDADEMLYVMAGDGIMRVGGLDVPLPRNTFAVIPKGTPHTLTHRNGPLMLAISVLSGAPCTTPGK